MIPVGNKKNLIQNKEVVFKLCKINHSQIISRWEHFIAFVKSDIERDKATTRLKGIKCLEELFYLIRQVTILENSRSLNQLQHLSILFQQFETQSLRQTPCDNLGILSIKRKHNTAILHTWMFSVEYWLWRILIYYTWVIRARTFKDNLKMIKNNWKQIYNISQLLISIAERYIVTVLQVSCTNRF